MEALVSATPSEMEQCFRFPIFSHEGNSKGFHLTFSTIIVLTPWVMEPVWEFCKLQSVPRLTIHSATGKISTGWILRHTQSTMSWLSIHNPLSPDFHKPQLSLVDHIVSWILQESVLIQNQYPVDPGKSVSFPLVYSSLVCLSEGRTRSKTFSTLSRSFLREPYQSLHSEDSVSSTWCKYRI